MRNTIDKLNLYERTCKQIAYNYKGYHIDRIAKGLVHTIIFEKYKWSFKLLIRLFFSRSFKSLPKKSCDIFLTFPEELNDRNDYKEIWEFVKSKVHKKSESHYLHLSRKFYFNFSNLILGYQLIQPAKYLSFSKKIRIWFDLILILNAIDSAESEIEIDVKKYVSFFSVLWVENLLTQYFKNRNIPTYNLQHGLIFFQTANPLDILQHTNIESDIHLAWGNYTKDELGKTNAISTNVLIAGYPKTKFETTLKKPQKRICAVFLSRIDYDRNNKDLLLMLFNYNKLQIEPFIFIVKLHPNLKPVDYQRYLYQYGMTDFFSLEPDTSSVYDVLKNKEYDFCICINSTTYYECYLHGLISLRYHSKDFDHFYDIASDEFSNMDQLSENIKKIYTSFEDNFDYTDIRKRLNYVIGCDEDNYEEILN